MVAALETTHVEINTVYFGGGTPSLLSPAELTALITLLREAFALKADAEITLEANPDDITPHILNSWIQSGINRLSVGLQSFDTEELKWMNRAHNAAQSLQSLQDIVSAGFTNFSVDLIYGSPLLANEQFRNNLAIVINKGIPHISAYALTVEPRTLLFKLIETNKSAPVNEQQQAEQFDILVSTLTAAGYEQYEISNFAKPGFRSKHNSSYWQGQKYFGFGPSAHSFNGVNRRRWNVANNALYINAIAKHIIPYEEEILTGVEQANEMIMIALRTSDGISLTKMRDLFGDDFANQTLQKAQKYIDAQKLLLRDSTLFLMPDGKFFADGIAADLFF